jgi:hypothetical protein
MTGLPNWVARFCSNWPLFWLQDLVLLGGDGTDITINPEGRDCLVGGFIEDGQGVFPSVASPTLSASLEHEQA